MAVTEILVNWHHDNVGADLLTWSQWWPGGTRWRWLWTPPPPGPCLWADTTPACFLSAHICREETSKWNKVDGKCRRRQVCSRVFRRISRGQSDTGRLDFSELIMTLSDSWANKTGRGEMRQRRWLSQAHFRSYSLATLSLEGLSALIRDACGPHRPNWDADWRL